MALGATSSDIQTMILRRGLTIAGAGVVAAIIAALATNRTLSALLYGVGATDIKTLIGVALFLAVIALLATLGPARFGARVKPVTALMSDG